MTLIPVDDSSAHPVAVRTVTGVVSSDSLGFTLPHEHLINSIESGGLRPDPDFPEIFELPMSPELAWVIRDRPLANRDNCVLDDPEDAAAELAHFRSLGGATVIEVTSQGQGRDLDALARLSQETGVQIIAGGGWYLERFHPDITATGSIDELLAELLLDEGTAAGAAPGVIGEIGISPAFTEREERSLRAACRLQRIRGVPLWIHLPGFVRHGARVLDVVLEEEGVPACSVVLCHMDPSGTDPDYQRALARRGVWLEFDMIGMPFRFSLPGEGPSPAPHETAAAIARLVDEGTGDRLLLSHDLFLKAMLRRNGGNGLSYIPGVFLDVLIDAGIDERIVRAFNTTNVRTLFERAARSGKES